MIVNGERVHRTSTDHAWVAGVRHPLRWRWADGTMVASNLGLEVVCVVAREDAQPAIWRAMVSLRGNRVHVSEHGSVARAQRACAKATRRAIELRGTGGAA